MKKHQELIDKYNQHRLTDEENNLLETLIEQGEIQLSDLVDLESLQSTIPNTDSVQVTQRMDAKFYALLEQEKAKLKSKKTALTLSEWWAALWNSNYQWAYSFSLVLIGLAMGYWFMPANSSENKEVKQLSAEIQEMKELMMLTMLEKNSSTERLKAVSLTSQMDTVSDNVAAALIMVLRKDESTSVRLAAVDALAQYTNDPKVRSELIASIKNQDSPLVQLALAELMVIMKEGKAVKEFQTIIDNSNTPDEVKQELQSAVQALI